ncbi:MAG: ATP synthase F1 subunit epsilon [Planctomycetota bacterium]|jgi:F-type H+-transporting ATPase subunit epsilon
MATLHCQVLTPEGRAYEGEATFVEAQAVDGRVGILPRHAPLLTALGQGPLRVRTADGDRSWTIEGGFLQVLDNQVSVVAERLTED